MMYTYIIKRRGIRGYFVALTFIFFIASSINIYAQDQHLMSLKDLTQRADYVLIGVCKNVRSFWNSSKTMIFTEIEHHAIANDFIFKGSLSSGTYRFIQPGGQVGNIKTIVTDQPLFSVGDRSLLFLYRPDRIKLSGTVGASFGKIPVYRDPQTEREFVVLWTLPQDKLVYYPVAPTRAAKRVKLSIQELKKLIESWSQEEEKQKGKEK